MFTAMIRRRHLLIAVPALALGLGVGWAAFELGRGRLADAPRTVTSAPTAEQQSGEAVRTQSEELPSTAVGAGAASGPDQSAEALIEQADPRAAVPEGRVERPGGVAQQPVAQAESPGTVVQPPPGEADRQAEAPSPPVEPESAIAEQPALSPTPSAVPQTAPSIPRDVPQPPASAGPAVATSPPGGSLAEQGASSDQPTAPAAARETLAARDPATEQPALAPPAPAVAGPSEPEPAAAQPDADETVALAEPAPVKQEVDPATRPAAAPVSREARAVPDEPVVEETAPARETDRPADESRAASARAAETLKRALATLFGGATDEAVPPAGGQAEVAAVPDAAPAGERGSAPGDPEAGPAPSFDIVRIAPGGRTVMAGRAAPGAEVEIRSGERTIDRVRADRRGEWVAVPPEPLAGGVQELSLTARVAGRSPVASEEVVVVAIPDTPDPPPPDLALPGVDVAPPQLAAAPAHEDAFAVALPREGGGKGRILQAPGRISSEGALALEMLDYDDAGRIRLSGEASAGAALRIYVDNEPAGAAVAGPSGRWDAVLEDTLTPGDYTLRLDQLGASGKPDARLETPFTRVSQPPVAGQVQVDYVIVQPGNSLWRIARRVLGEGMSYVHIYEANQVQIRDPDLIYPGQVFEIPSGIDAAG